MSSEVSLLVLTTGAVNQKTHNTFSVVRKVTNLLGEGLCLTVWLILGAGMGLVTVDDEITADDDDVGMGFSGGGKSWLVILLQNGVVQHNWYWSNVVMFSHGIMEVL